MADAGVDISEKIAEQIEKIARESIEIDLKIARYLKEDLDEIRSLARRERISAARLLGLILEGIKKGLIRSGKVGVEEMGKILRLARSELSKEEKKRA
ncbi:hypothetical protein [Hydrogenimonas sp.]